MEKKEFKNFCEKELKKRNFIKVKKGYYLNGKNGVLCAVFLQHSDYGNEYYINYYFFLGEYEDVKTYPMNYELDVQGRILVMSKNKKKQGENFVTSMIEYEEYTEDELQLFLDIEFEKKILPPVYQGKKYILDNLNTLYFLTLNKKEVMCKLQD